MVGINQLGVSVEIDNNPMKKENFDGKKFVFFAFWSVTIDCQLKRIGMTIHVVVLVPVELSS